MASINKKQKCGGDASPGLISQAEDILYSTSRDISYADSMTYDNDSGDDMSTSTSTCSSDDESDQDLCEYELKRKKRIEELNKVKSMLGLGPSYAAISKKLDILVKSQQSLVRKVNKLAARVDGHHSLLTKRKSTSSDSAQGLSFFGEPSPKPATIETDYGSLEKEVNDTVCGRQVNKLKLANALVQATPSAMALKLMACLFTKEELVNGNPSGESKSKDEQRQKTIKKLDSTVLRYIEDKVESKWPGSYRKCLRQMTQKCIDAYTNKANACFRH